jgi:GTPase SAR1 family protein
MATIDDIIQEEVNPFDPVTFYTADFWQESQQYGLTVDSIHQEAIAEITELLKQVAKDHQTRSILLCGDRGSGKSYLLSRLKQQLNQSAFFAYIGPWVEQEQIWRHILRYTVDSLMQKPAGETESQLLLWLKSLSAFRDRGLKKKILGERGLFIHNLRGNYPSGIYNPNEFFGVLYDLTNPDLYYTVCDWLRGDDLDEESLKAIRVKRSIETETDAKNILSNFGKISANTQPIVLCFDQIDKVAEPPNGYQELQALFTVNTTIHNERLKNFFIIISLIKNTWEQQKKNLLEADQDRIYKGILLKSITWDQAESLWAKRLDFFHQQASPKPPSPIYPLNRQVLEAKFPAGRTFPRYALQLARQLYQNYKLNLAVDLKANSQPETPPSTPTPQPHNHVAPETPLDAIAAFILLWQRQFKKTQEKILKIRHFSNSELIQMFREVLEALEVAEIKPRLLPSQKYSSASVSCQMPQVSGKVGLVWTEDENLTNFFHLMNACQKTINHNLCQKLYLIRKTGLGNAQNKGYTLYKQIFTGMPHVHIIPSLESVHYLATYHSLVNAAAAGELVVGDRTPNISELQSIVREAKILYDCQLLQDLVIFAHHKSEKKKSDSVSPEAKQLLKAKQYMLSLVETQQLLGRSILENNMLSFDMRLSLETINQLIDELLAEQKIQVSEPGRNRADQFIFWVPKSAV